MPDYDFSTSGKARRIDSAETFSANLDISQFVKKFGADFICSECDKVLVRIEPGGILGDTLNQIDTKVILHHHLTKHNKKRQ